MTFFYRTRSERPPRSSPPRRRMTRASPPSKSMSATRPPATRRWRAGRALRPHRCAGQQQRHRRATDLLGGLTDRDVADVFATNVGGVFNVTRAVVPHLIARRAGKIINISSVAGDKGGRGPDELRRQQGRAQRLHPRARGRAGAARHHRQRRGARHHRHRAVAGRARARRAAVNERILLRRIGSAGRGRARRRVPRLAPCRLHHRADPRRRRRVQDGVRAAAGAAESMQTVSEAEIAAVFPGTADIVADALARDRSEVRRRAV